MSSYSVISTERREGLEDTGHQHEWKSPSAIALNHLHGLSKRPLAFWFLNQWLEEAEMSRQILEMKEKGFGGFFMHPRGGLEIPYGSRRWYDMIEYCTQEAKRFGLEAWLYDEDPYPSGAAGGRVTLENPEFKAVELQAHSTTIHKAGEVSVDLPPGMLHAVYLIDEEGVHQIDEEAGIVRSEWRQGMQFSSYYPPYGEQGTPHWRAESHSPHFRVVTVVSKVPATLVGFVRRTVKQNPWGDFPDLMNGAAVDAFIRLTYERYHRHVGEEIGGVIPGIFSDESKLLGAMPWTPKLDSWTRQVGGVNLCEVLPHLALDLGQETPWFRWVYREALARGFLSQFADRMRMACNQLGLLWTGHFSPEEDPLKQVAHVPGLFRVLGRMDIPGTDLIGSNLGNARRPLLHLSPKIASSVAHLAGKPYVACEALAVTDWVQDFEFITRAIHWLFALGVNRIVTHGQYYSIDGLRKREAPPSQFYQAAGWEHMPAMMAQVERLSQFLSQGEHRASVLLYYPEETFMALTPQHTPCASSPSTAWLQRDMLGELVHKLLVKGYDFDLIDGESLCRLRFDKESGLQINALPDRGYQLILVPGCYITEQAWEHLGHLQDRGATVLFVEREITVLSRTPFTMRVGGAGGGRLLEQMNAHVSPLWEAEGDLIGHLRETQDGPLLFLCNNSDNAFSGLVRLVFSGPYEVCDPATGVWQLAGEQLRLDLPAGLGVLIRQGRPEALAPYLRNSNWEPMEAIWEPWIARPLSENALLLREFSLITQPRRSSTEWLQYMEAGGGIRPDLPGASAFHAARLVDLASPASLWEIADDGGDRYLRATFDWSGPLADIRLVCDSDLLPPISKEEQPQKLFFLNGSPLPPLDRRRTFDPMNLEASLVGLVRGGRNSLIWVQQGSGETQHALPYDGIRLFGDFQVEFPFSHSSLVQLSKRSRAYRLGAPVPPQLFGHAHYHGVIEYSSHVSLPYIPERLALRFGKVYESMEVVINGHSAGHLWKEPYRLEIPPGFLQAGRNRVELRCATSPANYLQGLQRPAGCLGPIEWCIGK